MRHYLKTIFLFLLLISCSDKNKKQGTYKITDDKRIVGDWTSCGEGTGYNPKDSSMNWIMRCVCLEVRFENIGNGNVTYPGGQKEYFVWHLEKNKLSIFNISKDENREFPDATYYVYFQRLDNLIHLDIKTIENENNYYYSLSKVIQP